MNDNNPENDKQESLHQHLCPWWFCFSFDNIFRRLLQNPERVIKPYVKQGWTILDVGPGMGYYTIPMAKLVGNSGKVIAADLQQQMLDGIHKRAHKAGVYGRIKLHLSTLDSIGINEPIDFCLAFWMAHEVPNHPRFFGEIVSKLKKDGSLLLVEPKVHVSKDNFEKTIESVKSAGLSLVERPKIFLSYAALLKK
jgi:ubiquinone/menaquinone biosynthesis C-methylase UbiE